MALRRALHAEGARFRLHRQLEKGCTPDIVMPRRRLAVFVDGCFWHGCPKHGRKPGSNRAYWLPKLRRNRERDAALKCSLCSAGWTVIRLWEHDLAVPQRCAARI